MQYDDLEKYIEEYVVAPFYKKRSERLKHLKLHDILSRKNPYLFRAKNIQTAGDLASDILRAHLSSQEETIFGNLLESLAIHINTMVYGGSKAEEGKFKSIDLIFDKANTRYLVSIKSGVHWGNADQIRRMKQSFREAHEIMRAAGYTGNIININGCMYGKDSKPFKQNNVDNRCSYYKYCGQEFWKFISGDESLYITLIKPLAKEVQQRDDEFKALYTQVTNRLTKDLLNDFTDNDLINWQTILEFVSKQDSAT